MEIAILITAIASLVTSVATIFTVYELKKQRIVTNKPILKIENKDENLSSDIIEIISEKKISLDLLNVGSGAAIDVDIIWDIDLKKIIELLKKYDPHNINDIRMGNGFFLIIGKNKYNTKGQIHQKISLVSEFNTSNSISQIEIPFIFIVGFVKYINEALLKNPEMENLKNTKPLENLGFNVPANVNLTYKDINNIVYNKTFSIEIKITSIVYTPKNKDCTTNITFYISEENSK